MLSWQQILFYNFRNMRVTITSSSYEVISYTQGGGGGTLKNFDRGAHVIFWGLKFDSQLLFFGVAQNEGYFWGLKK